jgi:hypothetical protein
MTMEVNSNSGQGAFRFGSSIRLLNPRSEGHKSFQVKYLNVKSFIMNNLQPQFAINHSFHGI